MLLKVKHYFLLVFLGCNHILFAQGVGQSPYSTIGVGELSDETNAFQDMMGGTGVSFTNTFYVNGVNPALLAKGRIINGVKYVALNFSAKGYFRNQEQGGNLGQDFGMNLSNLSMAFPILPRWAVGVGFKPYSNVDNENTFRKAFDGSSSIGNYSFKDAGGLSKVSFTNSFLLAKGLYAGVEGQYFFGNIVRDTTLNILNDYTGIYFRNKGRYNLKGTSIKAGLAYQQKLSKKWNANFGATYQLGSDVKGEFLNVFQKMDDAGNGLKPITGSPLDTLAISNFSTSLPSKYKVGISLEKPFNWLFAVEYGMTDWEGISKPFDDRAKKSLRNSSELNVGLEWVPNVTSGKFFNQVFYRAGFKSVTTPYYLNNIHVKDNSFSFGVSLPLGKGSNYLDLGGSLGRRGTLANNLVQENYAKVFVSFSMVTDWFYRPRIQ